MKVQKDGWMDDELMVGWMNFLTNVKNEKTWRIHTEYSLLLSSVSDY